MSKLNEVLARNVNGISKSILDFSHSVAFSHYNNLSAQLPIEANGDLVVGGIFEQATQCLKNIDLITRNINHNLDDVVRLTVFVKNKQDINIVIDVINNFYKNYKPTVSFVVVKDLPLNALVQIESVVSNGEGTIPNAPQAGDLIKVVNNAKNVATNNYSSHSVAFSHYNHLSAQLPIDVNGKIIGDDLKSQTKQALRNIKNILESMDVPYDDIVKVNIYTTEIEKIDEIKEVYKTFFPDSAIARTVNYLPALTINQVEGLLLDAKIQIEVTVSHGDGTPPQLIEDRHGIVIRPSNSSNVAINSFSTQSVAFSHYNNISEQLPIDVNGKVVSNDVNEQLVQCLNNLKTIVENINHNLDDVVKLNIYLKDIDAISGFETIIKKFFTKSIPAGRVIAVSDLANKDALVKIDAIVANAEGTPPTK